MLIKIALALLLLVLSVAGSTTWAQADGASPGSQNFGQYLVDHQADVAPFFTKTSGDFVAQAVPYVLEWLGRITFVALIIGLLIDVLLSRGFAMLFAPSLIKLSQSVIYATGRLVLSVTLTALMGLSIIFVAGSAHLVTVLVLLGICFTVFGIGVQVAWIYYVYRTEFVISLLFFLTLVVVHGFIGLAISAPLIGARAGTATVAFVDHTVTPRVESEAKAAKDELAAAQPSRDAAANDAARMQDQIDQAKSEQVDVQKEIEEQKNSEIYLFSQIVKVHARGDLAAAHDQLAGFLVKFPNSALKGLVQGQLTQVTNEIAAQDAQKKATEAGNVQAAAQAQADLLARAGKGEATLSEMRHALIGKTRAQVSAMFGPPSETASDRWGYGGHLVVNPLTNEKSGLAIYFTEGTVQSVDYYYGAGR